MMPGRWYFVWGPRNTEIYDPNNKLWANLQKPKAITDVLFQDRVKGLCDLLNLMPKLDGMSETLDKAIAEVTQEGKTDA